MDNLNSVPASDVQGARDDKTAWTDPLTSAVEARPVLKHIPLSLIVAARNPRYASRSAASMPIKHGVASTASASGKPEPYNIDGADPDLEGLARSLGPEGDPRLAEPPIVEELPDGRYRLCAGERRVEAARLASWTSILCLVYHPMDPVRAHTLSLIENLHRLPMHPLEEISALCISRLLANADARGVGADARRLLEDAWGRKESSYNILRGLEQILRDSGWAPERPDVSWKTHLDNLGISMAPWERKRKLRLLNIDPTLQEPLRELDITEAALRSLGTLEPEDQKKVVEALSANPSLARKVRRIARARRDKFYDSIDDALAEVQGLQGLQEQQGSPISASLPSSDFDVPTMATGGIDQSVRPSQLSRQRNPNLSDVSVSTSTDINAPAAQDTQLSAEVQNAVLQLLECADRLSAAMSSLEDYNGGATLPEPWGAWSRDALSFIDGLLTRP